MNTILATLPINNETIVIGDVEYKPGRFPHGVTDTGYLAGIECHITPEPVTGSCECGDPATHTIQGLSYGEWDVELFCCNCY